jgi:hypothetical protein
MSQYARTERPPLGGDHTAALGWLQAQLSGLGLAGSGPVELAKERPWATVFRAETTGGVVWLKLPAAGTRFEVGLYALMHRIAPAHVLEPLAIDVERAWIVLPDGGSLLADRIDLRDPAVDPRWPDLLAGAFAQYGELQLGVAGHVDDLLAIGVTDMRAEVMPERFEEALAFVAPYVARRGTADEHAAYEALVAMRGQVREWCRRLAEAPGSGPRGGSMDHNDLHPWNVFWAPDPGGDWARGRARFYDWGDAVLAHPFASMLVGLRVPKLMQGLADDDPRLLRVRDAYLEPFGSWAPRAELVETLELACRVAQIARSLVWARAVGEMGVDAPDSYQTAPMEHLSNLLDPSYLGS